MVPGGRCRSERDRIGAAIGGPFTALHAFASDRRRCVRLEEWLLLARELEARGETVLWVGSRAELLEVRAARGGPQRARFADELTDGTLRESARLFVGHDSGPLHVANAFGVPVVGVFAPGQPRRTFPQGTGPMRVLHEHSPERIDAHAMIATVDALATDPGVLRNPAPSQG